MKKIILFALVFLPSIAIAVNKTVKSVNPACIEINHLKDIMNSLDDDDSYRKIITRYVVGGQCEAMNAGEEVFIEDATYIFFTQVRRINEKKNCG